MLVVRSCLINPPCILVRHEDRRSMRATVSLLNVGCMLVAMCSPETLTASSGSHCSSDETVLFSCRTGNKTVSVCASPDLSTHSGSLQYRFGPRGAPEIRLPQTPSEWRSHTRSGVLTFAGGGGAYLAFTTPPYRYVVYTAIGRGWGNKAGVSVDRDGRLIRVFPCTDPPVSELGPDLFRKAAVSADQQGFDLP